MAPTLRAISRRWPCHRAMAALSSPRCCPEPVDHADFARPAPSRGVVERLAVTQGGARRCPRSRDAWEAANAGAPRLGAREPRSVPPLRRDSGLADLATLTDGGQSASLEHRLSLTAAGAVGQLAFGNTQLLAVRRQVNRLTGPANLVRHDRAGRTQPDCLAGAQLDRLSTPDLDGRLAVAFAAVGDRGVDDEVLAGGGGGCQLRCALWCAHTAGVSDDSRPRVDERPQAVGAAPVFDAGMDVEPRSTV